MFIYASENGDDQILPQESWKTNMDPNRHAPA
jgi:hypothetical protein